MLNPRNLPSWEELKSYKVVHKQTIDGIEQEVVDKALVFRLVVQANRTERVERLPERWGKEITKQQYEAYYQRYLNRRKPQYPINEQRGFSLMIIGDGDLSQSAKKLLFDESGEEDN